MVTFKRVTLLYLATIIIMVSLAHSTQEENRSLSTPYVLNLSINGINFEDSDANGFRSDGEQSLSSGTVRLMQNGTELMSATTDEQGTYSFSDLPPGKYEVAEDPALGWNQTAPKGGSYLVTLTDKSAYRLDFGNFRANNFSAMSPARRYPTMRPTPEEARRWTKQYKAAPQAYLSPKLQAELAVSTGAAFSLLDYLQYIPAERDQGYCGNCWAWSGTGAMEIDNAYKNGIEDRLSIQYLNSNFQGGSGPNWACCGGWLGDVADFYTSTRMAVPWSNANAHWQDGSRFCGEQATSVSASAISTNPNYTIASVQAEAIPTQGVGKETAIANIKNVLHQGKAVWLGYLLPNNPAWTNFITFWGTEPEESVWQPDYACGENYDYAEGVGHAVLCVGYNDTDPNNRYWIILNSWGAPANRPNGLFCMNMDMNYDCNYPNFDFAFYWMSLNIEYSSGPNNPPEMPTAPLGTGSGYIGTSYSFSTSAIDPDEDTVKYTFDWGDETSSETAFVSSGTSAFASHSWDAARDYNVEAMATDSRGLFSEWSSSSIVSISSENRPPTEPALPTGPFAGYAWASYSYTTSASDPDGDLLSYTFDWGDGATSEVEFISSGASASASHAWSRAGTYYVKAKASDGNGGTSPWSSPQTVKISANRLPATPAVPSGQAYAFRGASCSYSASASDLDKDKVKYTFDCGDGTSSETAFVRSGSKASVAHIWNDPGTFQVKAKATDIKGAPSPWSGALTVTVADNQPPNNPAVPLGPVTGRPRVSYKYNAYSTDPDGDKIKYVFNWGDGTASETALVNSDATASASHKWKKAGAYYVRAKAIDSKGASSDWSSSITIRLSSTGRKF